jgi:hypothetical protein
MIENVKNKKPGRLSFLAIKIAHKPNNKKVAAVGNAQFLCKVIAA